MPCATVRPPLHSPRRLVRYRRRQIGKRGRQRCGSRLIVQYYELPISTVVTAIRRLGLNRMSSLEPPRPVVRYERDRPGELVHLDIKAPGKIGRAGHRIHDNRRTRVQGIGWKHTNVAINNHSRLSSPKKRRRPRRPFCAARWPGTPPRGSWSSGF